jgi:hypothetical protein
MSTKKVLAGLITSAIFLASVFGAPSRSQESQTKTSVAEAARNSRAQIASSARHPRVITNADLGVQDVAPNASVFLLPSSSPNAADVPVSPATSCDNPGAQRLNMELQAAEQELAKLRSDLSYQPPVISDHDLDAKYFQPGNSGLNVGSPPLLDAEPPAPARVTEVELGERIASLQKALRTVCQPPDAARIQIQIDDLDQQLDLLQRQFSLDGDAYYSKPNFVEDTRRKAQLDAELQQVQSLQSEIEQLRQQLAALNIPQT